MFWIEVMPCLAHHSSPRFMMARSCACSSARRIRVRLAAGRKAEPHAAFAGEIEQRPEGLALAQLALGKPVLAHDDLVARAELLAVQQPGQLQRLGVGPHRVVVGRGHRERPVGDDAVEMVARDALVCRQDRVVGALRLQQLRLGMRGRIGAHRVVQRIEAMHAGELQMVEDRRRRRTDAYALR